MVRSGFRGFTVRYRRDLVVGAIALLACACVVVACGGGSGDERRRLGVARITGGTAKERAYLRRFLERVENSGLRDVRLQPLRRSMRFPLLDDRPYMWLSFTIRGSDPVTEVRSEWKALLVAGAARDSWSEQTASVRPVAGVGLNIRTDDGKETTEASFPVQPPPRRGNVSATEEQVADAIHANADAAAMKIEALEFTRPLGIAPTIRARVSDPVRFRGRANYYVGTLLKGLVNPPRIDGFDIEVRSARGQLVQVAVHSLRLNFSTGWISPEFR